jgi:cytochrome c biogenesis protein CcmG/thiol:disulfide interchange protein DsbE
VGKITTNQRRSILSLLILGFGLAWIAMNTEGQVITNHSISAPRRGFIAPDFSLVNMEGQEIRLSDFRGHPVMVNFWASWCPPCKTEMPSFQKIYTEYEAQGFVILAINAQESRATALAFAQSRSITFPILLDEDGTVSRLYLANSLPTTLFIGKDGYIREVIYGGPISEALLRIQVEKLLEETP